MSQAACVEQSEHSCVGVEGVSARSSAAPERGVRSQGLLQRGLHRLCLARAARPCLSVTSRELCHECCPSPSSMPFLFLR